MPTESANDIDLEKTPVIPFLNEEAKKLLQGQTIEYAIHSVEKGEFGLVLVVKDVIDTSDLHRLRMNDTMKNTLIDKFGSNTSSWLDKPIKIRFDKFEKTNKKTGDLSMKGTQSTILD